MARRNNRRFAQTVKRAHEGIPDGNPEEGRGLPFTPEERSIAKTLAIHFGSTIRAVEYLKTAWDRSPSFRTVDKWRYNKNIPYDPELAAQFTEHIRLKIMGQVDRILDPLAEKLVEEAGKGRPLAQSLKHLADAYATVARLAAPKPEVNANYVDARGSHFGNNVVLPFALKGEEDEDDILEGEALELSPGS